MIKQDIITAGNKIYAVCPQCEGLVRLNKPILGSLHICTERDPYYPYNLHPTQLKEMERDAT